MGSEALVVGASVSKKENIDALFKEVTDKWGRVDVLVNNAGMYMYVCVLDALCRTVLCSCVCVDVLVNNAGAHCLVC